MIRIAYIGFPEYELDYKWMNYFAEKTGEYEVICLSSGGEGATYPFISKQIKVYPVFPSYFPIKNIRLTKQFISKANQLIAKHQIDIVHCLYAYPTSLWACEIGHPNTMISTRGSDVLLQMFRFKQEANSIMGKLNSFLLKKKYVKSLKYAKRITSTSMAQRDKLYEWLGKVKTFDVVRTGIDLAQWQEMIAKFDRTESNTFTVFSSRTNGVLYNSDLIVKAIAQLKVKYADRHFKLIMINYFDADYDRRIEALVKDLDLEKEVDFVGPQDYEGMAKLYVNCDMTISVPSSDGTPNSVIESILTHKPAVISALKYDKDLFNEETVWQADSFEVESIVAQMEKVIELGQEERKQKLDKAYKIVSDIIDLNQQRSKIESIYKDLVNGWV